VIRRARATVLHKNEDPDTRFPMLDLRPSALQQTAGANRNALRLFSNVKDVWQSVLEAEKEDGINYDVVFFSVLILCGFNMSI